MIYDVQDAYEVCVDRLQNCSNEVLVQIFELLGCGKNASYDEDSNTISCEENYDL